MGSNLLGVQNRDGTISAVRLLTQEDPAEICGFLNLHWIKPASGLVRRGDVIQLGVSVNDSKFSGNHTDIPPMANVAHMLAVAEQFGVDVCIMKRARGGWSAYSKDGMQIIPNSK